MRVSNGKLHFKFSKKYVAPSCEDFKNHFFIITTNGNQEAIFQYAIMKSFVDEQQTIYYSEPYLPPSSFVHSSLRTRRTTYLRSTNVRTKTDFGGLLTKANSTFVRTTQLFQVTSLSIPFSANNDKSKILGTMRPSFAHPLGFVGTTPVIIKCPSFSLMNKLLQYSS